MRLLVVTSRYPTPDRPAAGAFVRDRLADPSVRASVVAPRRYDGPRAARFARLAWGAATTRGRFDGVEVHFVLPSGPLGLFAARLRGRPLVVVAHGSDVRNVANRSVLHRWLARRVIHGAAVVVANSSATAAHVAALGGRAEVIPPGVDLDRFGPSPRPAQRRVLYLGGDAAGKGVAVARVLADTLLGPGIREVPPADVPALMTAHDVILVPSAAEGFGLVAAEAIASGRWVVAAAEGGLLDTVTDGVNGTLVRNGDFAAALEDVPDYDPAAVAATAQRFGVDRYRVALAEVWQRVLGSPIADAS